MRQLRELAGVTLFWLCGSGFIIAQDRISVPIAELGKRFDLIGKLHAPLGKIVTVQGYVIEGPFKGYEGGPTLRVQRIGGTYTQEDIQIHLTDMTRVVPEKKVDIKIGESYELEGYESGGFVGHPGEIWKDGMAWVQTTHHYFSLDFNIIRGKPIAPVRFTPYEFQGRKAVFTGMAVDRNGQAVMEVDGSKIVVDAKSPWQKGIVGKRVETLGFYNPTRADKTYLLVDGRWRPVSLDDQLGQQVELRGIARSLNDIWWFDFRGTDMYVENMSQLPGWTREVWGRPIVIRGTLEKAMLPRIDQISLRSDRGLRDHYIIRKASWEPLDTLLSPELSTEQRGVADLTKLKNDDE